MKHLNRNELDKVCFAYDVTYCDNIDLAKKTVSDKVLKDRAYGIARDRGYDGYQRALASMVYRFFDKKTGSGINVNEQLAGELHKPVIKESKRRKLYARFKDNVWAENLADRKPNKLLVDQGSEFYNKLMKEWLDNNDTLMYSTHNEGKSVITEKFIKTLKAKHKTNDLKGKRIIGSFYEKE